MFTPDILLNILSGVLIPILVGILSVIFEYFLSGTIQRTKQARASKSPSRKAPRLNLDLVTTLLALISTIITIVAFTISFVSFDEVVRNIASLLNSAAGTVALFIFGTAFTTALLVLTFRVIVIQVRRIDAIRQRERHNIKVLIRGSEGGFFADLIDDMNRIISPISDDR